MGANPRGLISLLNMFSPCLILSQDRIIFVRKGEGATRGVPLAGGEGTSSASRLKSRGEMGIYWRRCGSKYYARGPTSKVSLVSSPLFKSSFRSLDLPQANSGDSEICSRLVGEGHHSGSDRTRSSVFFEDVHSSQKEWEETSNFRPVAPEQAHSYSQVQDGNTGQSSKTNCLQYVGYINRHHRCIPSCANKQGFPKILCLQTGRQNLCISINAIRPNHSSLGLFQGNQANKGVSSSSRDNRLFIPRRFSYPSVVIPRGVSTHQVDRKSFGVARLSVQQRKVVSSPSPKAGISRHCVRSSFSNNVSPSGQSRESLFSLSSRSKTLLDVKKGIGKFGRFPEFCYQRPVVGKAFLNPLDKVDDRPHFRRVQGPPSLSGPCLEGGVKPLGRSEIPRTTSSYEYFRPYSRYNVRSF